MSRIRCNKHGVITLALTAALLLVGCAGAPARKDASADKSPAGEQTQMKYDQALTALNNNQVALAENLFKQVIADKPGLSAPYFNLGVIAEKQGDLPSAKTWYGQALDVNPKDARALNQLAVLAREEGDFENALAFYERALQAEPNEPVYHRNIAILYDMYLGDYVRALEHYQRCQELRSAPDEQVAMWIADLERRIQ
ncbi:FOG: TPR repeat [Hahella chejuensis KCTC 2396]|uniref:FOG: TPR repeat n=1 Tax=Hahella chejuensis (strain KCTC 2396) TaxID=349521 RepID=Q2SIV6_HAHCH|nr:tetratricopeptide repeat protein [Hahella chejuensis]ABC29418.1 FOG: TPR repeat [Hahella chejuensis KCTC 2396]